MVYRLSCPSRRSSESRIWPSVVSLGVGLLGPVMLLIAMLLEPVTLLNVVLLASAPQLSSDPTKTAAGTGVGAGVGSGVNGHEQE